MLPKICVITPTKNAICYLERFFKAINSLDYPKDKIVWIFADAESSDGTYEYINESKIKFKKTVLIKKNSTRPNTRNEAYRYVRKKKIQYDYVASVDSDVVLPPDFFRKMLVYMNDKDVGMVCGYFMYNTHRFLSDYTNSYLGKKIGKSVNTGFCPTGCVLFRKECFGFFDESFLVHEDGDFSLSITKAGWKGIQDFTITCSHLKKQTIKKELKDLANMGYYEPLLWIKHPWYFKRKKTLFGSLYYFALIFSIPLFLLSLSGIAQQFKLLFPSLLTLSLILHFFQIKNKNPIKRLIYSAFTVVRFCVYFTSALSRLIGLPFEEIKFTYLKIKHAPGNTK